MIRKGSSVNTFQDEPGDSTDDAIDKVEYDLYKPYGTVPCPRASTYNDRWWLNGNRRRHKRVAIKRSIFRRRK